MARTPTLQLCAIAEKPVGQLFFANIASVQFKKDGGASTIQTLFQEDIQIDDVIQICV